MSEITKTSGTKLGAISSYLLGDLFTIYDQILQDTEGNTQMGAFRNMIAGRINQVVVASLTETRTRAGVPEPTQQELSQVGATINLVITVIVALLFYFRQVFKDTTRRVGV